MLFGVGKELPLGRKSPIHGICHICGEHKKLSFEHVPPESAFNDQPVRYGDLMDILNAEELGTTPKTRRYSQRGTGDHTLCDKCNNDTGSWYSHDFALWCYQGMDILRRSGFEPRLIYLHRIFPLRILKQIVTMMLSVCASSFQAKHPDLVKFVLNKEWRYLSPEYRFFIYFNIQGVRRTVGNDIAIGQFDEVNGPKFVAIHMHEITFPPYGYVMTLHGQDPVDARLVEITHFKNFWYDEIHDAPLHLPLLLTELPIPGDYRSRAEIDQQIADNIEMAEKNEQRKAS